jgi:hypothetical protein
MSSPEKLFHVEQFEGEPTLQLQFRAIREGAFWLSQCRSTNQSQNCSTWNNSARGAGPEACEGASTHLAWDASKGRIPKLFHVEQFEPRVERGGQILGIIGESSGSLEGFRLSELFHVEQFWARRRVKLFHVEQFGLKADRILPMGNLVWSTNSPVVREANIQRHILLMGFFV